MKNKLEKSNWIKCWLQKFGRRDNETFSAILDNGTNYYELSLQYSFDFDDIECEPFDWCRVGRGKAANSSIIERSEYELDEIIEMLKYCKTNY